MRGLKRLAALALALCLLATMCSTIVSAESEQTADPSVLAQQFTERVKSLQTLSVKMEDLPQDRIASANSGAVSYSTRAISNSNYNTLRNFINNYGLMDDNGNKVYLETIEDSGWIHYFALTNLSSGIHFRLFTKSSDSVRVDASIEFTLTNSSNYISITGSAICYYYNSAEDFVAQTITYDQRNYTDSTTLPFTQSSIYGYITASDFCMLMSNAMSLLCKYWDVTIYDYLGFGLVDLGFTSYDGISSSCTNHSYDNACDATCNNCGATRTVTHTYGSSCDTTCNICGATRSTSYSHSYTSDCDAACDNCWAIRTPVSNHAFNGNIACSRCYAMFSDVSTTSWQIDHVVYVYDKGLMAGKGSDQYGDVKFDPNSPITREEFVQVLYNAEGKPSVAIANRFPDVLNNGWYKNAVLWANQAGIASGMGNGSFGVGMNITRQDLAMMLYKYARMKGCPLDAEAGKINQYADGNKVSEYAKNAMDWAVTNGVLRGKGAAGAPPAELNLDPTGTATRAECAAMLRNFMTAFGL